MSATSGIGTSPQLSQTFADAVDPKSDTRFLKVSIENESLVPGTIVPISGTLEEDLSHLQDILEDDVPAYVLVKLDGDAGEWLAISYVPDSAKVRDKMLYASTRNSLTKSLGSTHFIDAYFATSKSDLTPDGYAAYKRHMAAPLPLSLREKELEDARVAERVIGASSYLGSNERRGHVGEGVGYQWSEAVQDAVKELAAGYGSHLLVLSIDTTTETLFLASNAEDRSVDDLAFELPSSEPAYALLAWPHSFGTSPRRDIVFIYSCPSSSLVKHRMLYSSGALAVMRSINSVITSINTTSELLTRKIETSDPTELTEAYLRSELGLVNSNSTDGTVEANESVVDKKPFARPRGPGRKR